MLEQRTGFVNNEARQIFEQSGNECQMKQWFSKIHLQGVLYAISLLFVKDRSGGNSPEKDHIVKEGF